MTSSGARWRFVLTCALAASLTAQGAAAQPAAPWFTPAPWSTVSPPNHEGSPSPAPATLDPAGETSAPHPSSSALPWYLRYAERRDTWDLRADSVDEDESDGEVADDPPVIVAALAGRAGTAPSELGRRGGGIFLNSAPLAQLDLEVHAVRGIEGSLPFGLFTRVEAGPGARTLGSLLAPDARAHVTRAYAIVEADDSTSVRVGTLDATEGPLQLFEKHVARVLHPSLGISVDHSFGDVDVTLGAGDAGMFLRRDGYAFVGNLGGALRGRPSESLELAIAGEVLLEPGMPENLWAERSMTTLDHATRRAVAGVIEREGATAIERADFLAQVERNAFSFRVASALSLYGPSSVTGKVVASVRRELPDRRYDEELPDLRARLALPAFSDERYEVTMGGEASVAFGASSRLRVGGLVTLRYDVDDPTSSEHNSSAWSGVGRGEVGLLPGLEWLIESSVFAVSLRPGAPSPQPLEGSFGQGIVQAKTGLGVHFEVDAVAIDLRAGGGVEYEWTSAVGGLRYLAQIEGAIRASD